MKCDLCNFYQFKYLAKCHPGVLVADVQAEHWAHLTELFERRAGATLPHGALSAGSYSHVYTRPLRGNQNTWFWGVWSFLGFVSLLKVKW